MNKQQQHTQAEPKWLHAFDIALVLGPKLTLTRRQVLDRAISLSAGIDDPHKLILPQDSAVCSKFFDDHPKIAQHVYIQTSFYEPKK